MGIFQRIYDAGQGIEGFSWGKGVEWRGKGENNITEGHNGT